jgi:hypothetical protein
MRGADLKSLSSNNYFLYPGAGKQDTMIFNVPWIILDVSL